MKKLKLRFSEEFTVHATALINHIHSQPRRPKYRSLESRLQQMNDSSSPLAPRAEEMDMDLTRATAVK